MVDIVIEARNAVKVLNEIDKLLTVINEFTVCNYPR